MSYWEKEVHAYEQWAPAFGELAPRMVAVHEEEPLALLVNELPGKIMKQVQLSSPQEKMVWRTAGRALADLHGLTVGEWFGPCLRNGECTGTPITDAKEYISKELDKWMNRGIHIGCINSKELSIIHNSRDLIPAFAGEHPVPCHRDYSPVNWLVTDDGVWAGIIDFEFAYWDVRVADFSRYPDWEWIGRPDLLGAFFDGYGCPLTPEEEQQCLVAHVLYALTAIVWGCEHSYHGFAEEGRQALKHLNELLD